MRQAALAIVFALAAAAASAQPYAISWSTVDGGGAMGAAGGTFTLDGTAGQPDAGGPFAGSPFALHAGFWSLAAGSGGPQADLSLTKTDGQATAVPGTALTYTIVASNAGPSSVASATVLDTPPAALLGVTWTCTASGGSSCPASGSGLINASVSLLVGGSATFALTGTIDPAATGTLANTAGLTPPSGVTDPALGNNSATDSDRLDPRADLALAIADAPDPVAPGAPLVYALTVTNDGPSRSPGMTLVSTPDPLLVDFVASSPAAPTCQYASNALTCALGALDPGGTSVVTVHVRVKDTAAGPIVNDATVAGAATDPVAANNAAQAVTAVQTPPAFAELAHGTRVERALPAAAGSGGDLFRIRQDAHSSYEVVVDAASGDLGTGEGPALERVDAGGTVLQSAQAAGTGPARTLRFANPTSTAIEDQLVRVRARGAAPPSGADDTYRLRAWDTTLLVPRFNNTASQVTVVLMQNPTAEPVTATLFFWSPEGTLLASVSSGVLPPKGLLVVSSAGVPGLAGASGSLTVVHDAPYGALAGKTVALEPATGFSFDSPMLPRPR